MDAFYFIVVKFIATIKTSLANEAQSGIEEIISVKNVEIEKPSKRKVDENVAKAETPTKKKRVKVVPANKKKAGQGEAENSSSDAMLHFSIPIGNSLGVMFQSMENYQKRLPEMSMADFNNNFTYIVPLTLIAWMEFVLKANKQAKEASKHKVEIA